jgi:hypothetical protein
MKGRLALIILIILIVLVGAGIGWWFLKIKPSDNGNKPSNTNSANVDTTNTTPVSLGALVVGRMANYREVNFNFTTASIEPEYNGQTAPEGKTYVIIYYSPVQTADQNAAVINWASTDIMLKADGDRSYAPKQVKAVTAAESQTDEGYLWYEVDAAAANFSLQFGQEEGAYVIKLNF